MAIVPLLIAFGIVAGIIGVIWMMGAARAAEEKARAERILKKYGNTETAHRILKRVIWQGETESQLRDSLGSPADIDEKVLKTKRKAVWKYHHQGGNRYGLRITVENGEVVGWDEKM